MIDGSMQEYALTLDKFLTHAAKWHSAAEVVTARGEGDTERINYAGLQARARRVSAVLHDLGIRQGGRVATLAWNTQGHIEAWYGIMGMGAVCHTLNPRLTSVQLGAMVRQSEAPLLLCSQDLLPLARAIAVDAPLLRHILVLDVDNFESLHQGAAVPNTAMSKLLDQSSEEYVWGDFDENMPSGLCFTSGTTGAPKGVTYTHRGCYLHTLRQLQAEVFGLTAVDSILAVVPMFHANGWGLPFAAPAVGAKLVLPGRNGDGASLARLIQSEQVTIGVAVPTVWLGLVEHFEKQGDELPSLKRIVVGGSAMPPALMERLETVLGVTVQTTWGMTELAPLGVATPPGAATRNAAKSGRPAMGIDLLLTDAGGTALPDQRNVEGHLRVRGPTVVDRYFGSDQTATDVDGWFDTGDLARIDPNGNLSITGRSKDLIKSGGEWINPAEIEAVIASMPEVALAAVIGRTDPKWGERPILLVKLQDDTISDEDLLAPLRDNMASWWIPDAVIRLDTMPLASTGKIDKMQLRLEYERV